MVSTVLAVDGNSLVHRAYHAAAGTGLRTADGRPIWAVRGLVSQLLEAIDRFDPVTVVVGFDDAEVSHRRERWPHYKAHRTEKLDTLVSQLALAIDTLDDLGIPVVVPAGLEADDVLASVARRARDTGHRAVVMTSDRDAFCLIDESTSVLRIINGGVDASPLLTPDRLDLLLGIRPEQYRDYAAIRGDASDNLPGIRGIGPKIAAKLLSTFGSVRDVFESAHDELAATVGSSIAHRLAEPDSKAAWELNCQVMAQRDDLDLPPVTALLPLEPDAVRRTCALLQMHSTLPKAMRLLAHVEGAAAPDNLAWSQRREPTNFAAKTFQRFPPLPRKADAPEQPALFSL